MKFYKAMANFNMNFNNGNFIKNKVYTYRMDPDDSSRVLITTEKNTEQKLWYTEFDTLFTILKN